MRNIALRLEYDGRLFHGWQSQINAPTVQDTVAAAIRKLDGCAAVAAPVSLCDTVAAPVRLIGASRTDTGVHARGQVANFHTESNIPADKYSYALNTVLPEGVVCIQSTEAPADFHARFCATEKTYSYLILNRRPPSALYRDRAWHIPLTLDISAMRRAAALLTGEHDFRAFMSTGSPVKSTVRTITRLEIITCAADATDTAYSATDIGAGTSADIADAAADTATDISVAIASATDIPVAGTGIGTGIADTSDPAGAAASDTSYPAAGTGVDRLIRIIISGNGFLYNMVRIITGTLVYVGQHKLDTADVRAALTTGLRESAGKTAPPQGLCLERVNYADYPHLFD